MAISQEFFDEEVKSGRIIYEINKDKVSFYELKSGVKTKLGSIRYDINISKVKLFTKIYGCIAILCLKKASYLIDSYDEGDTIAPWELRRTLLFLTMDNDLGIIKDDDEDDETSEDEVIESHIPFDEKWFSAIEEIKIIDDEE